jgi:hypothetical protein
MDPTGPVATDRCRPSRRACRRTRRRRRRQLPTAEGRCAPARPGPRPLRPREDRPGPRSRARQEDVDLAVGGPAIGAPRHAALTLDARPVQHVILPPVAVEIGHLHVVGVRIPRALAKRRQMRVALGRRRGGSGRSGANRYPSGRRLDRIGAYPGHAGDTGAAGRPCVCAGAGVETSAAGPAPRRPGGSASGRAAPSARRAASR